MTTYTLTNEQLDVLGNLINSGDRVGFYLQLYDYTIQADAASSQVAQLAQISSLSGIYGDAAVYANSLAAAEAPLLQTTYPGLLQFSLQIATAEYNSIVQNSGVFDDTEMQNVAKGVWDTNGLGAAFLDGCTPVRALAQAALRLPISWECSMARLEESAVHTITPI